MSENRGAVKTYICPSCFAKELDVCLMHYDQGRKEYYCTKCAYAGGEEDVKEFFSMYQRQKYKWMDRKHPAAGKREEALIEWPEEMKPVTEIRVKANGRTAEVLETESSYFVPAVCEGATDLEFQFAAATGEMKISPARLQLKAEQKGDVYSIHLDGPQHLYLDVDGLEKPVLWYGNPVKDMSWGPEATYYYPAGKVYEIGTLIMKSGESMYIEAGAVVRGRVHTEKFAENIHIGGYGILDAGCYQDNNSRTFLMDCCKNVQIEDITIIHTPSWHMMLAGCHNVHVDNVKEIGEVCGSDGVDIVGSSEVTVENCMFRNNDDCIAIKAFEGGFCDGEGNVIDTAGKSYWDQPVHDILIQNCIFMNEQCGNGIEIGHELQIDEVKDICFRNLDIVRSEGYGAAISIHAGDHATVRDVIFEDIRIENYSDFLFDIRVMKSRFNKDKERGQIDGVLLKNIQVNHKADHLGYTMSVIGGWDEAHKVKNVTFEDVYKKKEKWTEKDMLEIFERHTENIVFR